MIPLFIHAAASQPAGPASDLPAILGACERDELTGLVEIKSADVQIVLLFVEGMLLDARQITGEAMEKIAPSQLSGLSPAEVRNVRRLALPLEAVRVAKVLLDWHPPVETVPADPGAIAGYLETWAARPVTSMVHLTWLDAEGFVVLPGGVPPSGAIFVAGGRITSDAPGLAAIHAHRGGPCALTRYEARTDVAVVQEQIAHLRTAFTVLAGAVVARYAELLGSSMTNALMFDVNDAAQTNGWRVKVSMNGVADTHAFESAEAAARAYGMLMTRMIKHMTTVIGARLTNATILEAARRFSPATQQTLKTYRLVPAETLPGAGQRQAKL